MKTPKAIALVGIIQLVFIILTALFVLFVRHELRSTHAFRHSAIIAPASSWKKFSSVAGRFSIFFPGAPESTNILTAFGTTNAELHLFYVNPNVQNSFSAGYSDSPLFANAAKLPDPQVFLKNSQSFMVSSLQGKVVYQQESKVAGFPAREFECVAGGKANYSARVKYILAGQRVYEIHMVFLTAEPYPQKRDVFFNSFRILDNTNAAP